MDNLSFPSELEIAQRIAHNPELSLVMKLLTILFYIILFVGTINIIHCIIKIRKKHLNPFPSKEDRISLNFQHLLLIILVYYLILSIFYIIVHLLFSLYEIPMPDTIPYPLAIIIDLIARTILIFFIISLIKHFTHNPLREIGFSKNNFFNHLKLGILTIVSTTPILFIVIYINSEILGLKQVAPIVKAAFALSNPYTQIAILLNILIISPIAEEFFFRYLLNGCLKKELGVWSSIFLGGMIFAAVHSNASDFLPLAVLGITLSYIYELKKSITIVIIAHFLFNLTSIILLYIIKSLF